MLRVGLTGSIAMGKSTTAALFRERGAPVYDADAAAHRVYAPGGAAIEPVRALAPEAVGSAGVDRAALKRRIEADPAFLKTLEGVVHPLIAQDRAAFEQDAQAAGAAYAVYDIPLLYETGLDAAMDLVVVVSAPAEVQRARVLERGDMSEDMLEKILARQTPDHEKRARADFIVDTSKGVADAAAQVDEVIHAIEKAIALRNDPK